MSSQHDTAGERDLWERLPVALFRTTADGRIVDVNRSFIMCFRGPSRESMLGMRADELHVDAEDQARWRALVEPEGIARAFETQMRRRDGTTFWARATVQAVASAASDGVLYEGLIEDISEHKLLEPLLRAQEELAFKNQVLSTQQETSLDAILLVDENARILSYNRQFIELFRISEELVRAAVDEPVLRSIVDLTASPEEFLARIRYLYEHREEKSHDEISLKDGRLIDRYSAPVVGEQGRYYGRVWYFRDVSERKRAEEAQKRLVTAVEQSAETIVITDAGGSIVYANPAFEKTSGYTRAEAVGQNPRLLKSGKQDAEFYSRMWAVLSRGEVWRGRFINKRKDGALFEEDGSISPVLDTAGKIVNYVAVKRDVSNETRLEQQLYQAQKMEAIGRLAAGVAHDFNNLLGVITGYAEIVRGRLSSEDPLQGKVAQILRAALRAAGLTRQLLAFGRKQVLQPKILDLNAVVSDMEKMLRRLIGEDVELATALEPHLASVRADPGQIEQVLMNLAVNARDAMPEGGRITIETRNAELDAEYAAAHVPTRPGPYVLLAVTDTGTGMDAATQARIFEPFFSTKEVGKGTGLGLATVYGIVKQSDGFVWVYSELGLGTTFKIYLPRVDEEASLTREEAPGPQPRGVETVLLVEDEAGLRELLGEALEASGYSVLVASNGAEAVQVAGQHAGPIEIMVTDVIMPGITGPKTADLVAPMRPGMKVLFISGYSDEAVIRHGLIGPGRAFLSKPFGPDVLLRKVRETLDAA